MMIQEFKTGNFHVFFPSGCYREKLTEKRALICRAIDEEIQLSHFDIAKFEALKSAYLEAMRLGSKEEERIFQEMDELISPIFNTLLKKGFSRDELRNLAGEV